MPDSNGSPRAYGLAVGLTVSIALHATLIAALLFMLRDWRPPRPQGVGDVYVFLEPPMGSGPTSRAHGPETSAPVSPPRKLVHVRRSTRKLTVGVSKKTNASPAAISTPERPAADASNSSGSTAGAASTTGGGGLSGRQAAGAGGLGSGDSPFSGDQVDEPPVLLSRVVPAYPEDARRRRIEGEVVLRVVVDSNGRVENSIKVIESIPMLDRAAIEAVRKWRFSPGRNRDGTAVRVLLEVPLRFTLRAAD